MSFETAVVTGAASGLGRAFCVELAGRGARLVVSDIDQDGGAETVRLAQQAGAEASFVACDVRRPEEIEALERTARERLGEVDLLINNAGVAVAGPIDEVSLEDWRWVVDINLWGVIYGCRTFVPAMRARRRGYIINVASAAGLLSAPLMSPYNVTKAGVVALSETMRAELNGTGIHVSVLCPTFFKTRIAESSRGVFDAGLRTGIDKLMERSKVQAPEVAQAALASVEVNRLYTVPMADGRLMWRLKRLQPERFPRLLGSSLVRRITSRQSG